MDEMYVIVTILVDEVEVDDKKLKKYIMASRSDLCKKLNSGWIEHFNSLMDELDMANVDMPGYSEAYYTITNAYWTKLMHKRSRGKYSNLRIVDETLFPTSLNMYDCRIRLVTD